MWLLLVEQNGALGGAAVNSLVMPYMPFYTNIINADGKVEVLFHTTLCDVEKCGRKITAIEMVSVAGKIKIQVRIK